MKVLRVVLLGGAMLAFDSCAVGDDGPRRVSVEWTDLSVSDDRRSIEVLTGTPSEGSVCAHQPGGLELEMDGATGILTAWMREGEDAGGACMDICSFVVQSVQLEEPLAADVVIETPADAEKSCTDTGATRPVVTTTTRPDQPAASER